MLDWICVFKCGKTVDSPEIIVSGGIGEDLDYNEVLRQVVDINTCIQCGTVILRNKILGCCADRCLVRGSEHDIGRILS